MYPNWQRNKTSSRLLQQWTHTNLPNKYLLFRFCLQYVQYVSCNMGIYPNGGFPTFSTGFVQIARVATKSTSECYNPPTPFHLLNGILAGKSSNMACMCNNNTHKTFCESNVTEPAAGELRCANLTRWSRMQCSSRVDRT